MRMLLVITYALLLCPPRESVVCVEYALEWLHLVIFDDEDIACNLADEIACNPPR